MNKEKLQDNNRNLSRILDIAQNLQRGIPYTGDNPLTIGAEGIILPANTLIKEALQVINGVEPGVSGIDVDITQK